MIKILNLYAGIGGNRKLWENVDVTAIENNKSIAKIYQDFFPNDKVIIAEAHKFLLENYKEFDFIWSSPPCPSHSDIRRMGVDIGQNKPLYPDMKLYEEIILLKHFCKSKWVVENVKSYYHPLIKPTLIGRHYFWSNFPLSKIKLRKGGKIKEEHFKELQKIKGVNIDKYKINGRRKDAIIRSYIDPELGIHILKMAFKDKQRRLVCSSE